MAIPNFNPTNYYNGSSPAPATTFGLKISKPTYNALTTATQNLIFSSSWPSLQIAFQTTISSSSDLIAWNNGLGFSGYKVAHNLGYAPFSFAWITVNDSSGINSVVERLTPSVDENYVYFQYLMDGTTFDVSTTLPLNIKCFALDLSQDIDYTVISGDSATVPYDENYGIKIAKAGKSVYSTDMRDYILHSRCLSPLILAVKTDLTVNPNNLVANSFGIVQYASPLNYPSWNYGFIKNTNNRYNTGKVFYYFAPLYTQAYPRTFTDGVTTYLEYDLTIDSGATIVVLRDPLTAPNQVTAVY